jgi:hypothetical protein
MMEGTPVEDISGRFLDAISRFEEVADAVTPHDASRQLDEEALSHGEALYDEIDAEQGRSNIDIEKHLRRAELKLAQANAWLAMARELAWQRDDYGSPAR